MTKPLIILTTVGNVERGDAPDPVDARLEHVSAHGAEIVAAHVELEADGALVAGQTEEQVFQGLEGQLAERDVQVLERQGRREELLEARGNFFGFLTRERVAGDVQVD